MAFTGVLPEAPSFGQTMGRSLGQGLSEGIGKGMDYEQKLMMEKFKTGQKNKAAQDLISRYYGPKSVDQKMVEEFTPSQEGEEGPDQRSRGTMPERPKILDIPDEEIAAMTLVNPAYAKMISQQKKDAESKYNTKVASQGSFDDMVKFTPKVGYSFFSNPNLSFSRKRERSQFESSKGSLIAQAREQMIKGVFSNQKFEYIAYGIMPSHTDSEEVKVGKLKAIGKELGLNTSELDRLYPDIEPFEPERKDTSKKPKDKTSGMVKMRADDGSERFVEKSEVNKYIKKGAKVVK
jgi:hypothetical protein